MIHPWQFNPGLATSATACEPFSIQIKPTHDPAQWYAGRAGHAFVVTGDVPGIPGHWIVDTTAIAAEIPGGAVYAFVLKTDAEALAPEAG